MGDHILETNTNNMKNKVDLTDSAVVYTKTPLSGVSQNPFTSLVCLFVYLLMYLIIYLDKDLNKNIQTFGARHIQKNIQQPGKYKSIYFYFNRHSISKKMSHPGTK